MRAEPRDNATTPRPETREVHALLVAAGRGERLGGDRPKGRVLLAGRPLFVYALRTLLGHPCRADVCLLVPSEEAEVRAAGEILTEHVDPAGRERVRIRAGGARRQDTVRAGLLDLQERGASPDSVVVVHDAARPLLSAALLTRCLDALDESLPSRGQSELPGLEPGDGPRRLPSAAIPGLPVRETLKLVFEERVVLTQPRENLWSVQTPQVFRFGPILQAHRRALRLGLSATDDAALLEWQGMPVRLVPGDPGNLKVTVAEDLALAERLLELAR